MDTTGTAAGAPMSTPIYDEVVAAMAARSTASDVVPAADLPARLSDDAAWTVRLAEQEAQALGHGRVGVEHLLVGLLLAGGPVTRRLQAAGLELGPLRRAISRAVVADAASPHGAVAGASAPTWSSTAAAVLETARAAVSGRGHREVAPGDLLAALAAVAGPEAVLLGEPPRAA